MAKSIKRETFLAHMAETLVPLYEEIGSEKCTQLWKKWEDNVVGQIFRAAVKAGETSVSDSEKEALDQAKNALAVLDQEFADRASDHELDQALELAKQCKGKTREESRLISATFVTAAEKWRADETAEKARRATEYNATIQAISNKQGLAGVQLLIEKYSLSDEKTASASTKPSDTKTAEISAGNWLVLGLASRLETAANFRYFPTTNVLSIMPMKAEYKKRYNLEPGTWYEFATVEFPNCTTLQNYCYDLLVNVMPTELDYSKLATRMSDRMKNGNLKDVKSGGTSACYLITDDHTQSKHTVPIEESKEKYSTVI